MVTPRTYHSVAVLMPDATVWVGGGGLCAGCSTNHFDGQIFSPPYLFNADGSLAPRPVIRHVSSTSVRNGDDLIIATGAPIKNFALVRFSTATHSVNTDQRRIPLFPKLIGTNVWRVEVPRSQGVALPGFWLLFAIDNNGVPSVAKTIKITPHD
jgi:galactose oxidase